MTPRELHLLAEQWSDIDRQAARRFAVICATFANCNRNEEKKPFPFTPEDFMTPDTEPRDMGDAFEILKHLKQ